MATNLNCWEYLKCGKEKECPAYPNFGKSCFSVTGTLCKGRRQGEYFDKVKECRTSCQFYKALLNKS